MGRQDEFFSDAEKAWIIEQYQSPEGQAIVAKGGSYAKNLADKMYIEYLEKFGDPLPAEDNETYRRRLKNADATRKTQIRPIEAESEEKAEERKNVAKIRINRYVIEYHHRAKKKTSVPEAPKLPPITSGIRVRKIGGLDVFAQSDLYKSTGEVPLRPDGRADLAKWRTRVAEAFKGLSKEQQAEFEKEAEAVNADIAEEALEEAGSAEEVVRARMVPSAKLWTKRVMEHMKEQVHWVGGVLIGGPDEGGEMNIFNASVGLDGKGRDYFQALCEEIGWSQSRLKAFSMQWLHAAIDEESALREGAEEEVTNSVDIPPVATATGTPSLTPSPTSDVEGSTSSSANVQDLEGSHVSAPDGIPEHCVDESMPPPSPTVTLHDVVLRNDSPAPGAQTPASEIDRSNAPQGSPKGDTPEDREASVIGAEAVPTSGQSPSQNAIVHTQVDDAEKDTALYPDELDAVDEAPAITIENKRDTPPEVVAGARKPVKKGKRKTPAKRAPKSNAVIEEEGLDQGQVCSPELPPVARHPGLTTPIITETDDTRRTRSRSGRVIKASARLLEHDPVMTVAEKRKAQRQKPGDVTFAASTRQTATRSKKRGG
ncbi:hypothetical protein C8Q70DRAFT_1056241 [Cubamyces menziesii]|nr:hypothetical protein C8Q70DRAFT_1056241 [Cubamyces menziesii]